MLLKVTRISKINRQYDKLSHLEGLEYISKTLDLYGVTFEIPAEDLKRLPKEGPFITLSNHPLGGLDGGVLLKLMVEHRSDYKIIANFLLHSFKPLEPYVMPVNPFEDRKEAKSSHKGIKEAILHLREGKPLGIFPAGEVSTFKEGKNYVDKPWEPSAMRLVQKAKVPVIPIYFHARNSRLFYRLASVSSILQTAKLPSELFSQENKVIKVRIGNPVSVKDQEEHTDLEDFTNFLRKKTYMLAILLKKRH